MKPFARITCHAIALRRLVLVSSLALVVGCILPIPHYRQHLAETSGVVIDKTSRNPVANARIIISAGRYSQGAITDSNGRFSVESSGGWHFIWWAAPPSGGSLLPTYLYPQDAWHYIRIEAQGYPVHFEMLLKNEGGTYVIELDKERKGRKENPFLPNQCEENCNEENVDGERTVGGMRPEAASERSK